MCADHKHDLKFALCLYTFSSKRTRSRALKILTLGPKIPEELVSSTCKVWEGAPFSLNAGTATSVAHAEARAQGSPAGCELTLLGSAVLLDHSSVCPVTMGYSCCLQCLIL